MNTKIVIGCDHAGFDMKEYLKINLNKDIYELIDYGTYTDASCDYPDFSHTVAKAVNDGEFRFGILICGSGNGVCMVANRYEKVRAAICWNKDTARLARSHNDANIICLPSRFIDLNLAKEMVEIFLTTEFEGGRHQRRIDKISKKL